MISLTHFSFSPLTQSDPDRKVYFDEYSGSTALTILPHSAVDLLKFMHRGELHRTALVRLKVKLKLSLCFFLNCAPRHEGVLGEWMYSSTHSGTGRKMGV